MMNSKCKHCGDPKKGHYAGPAKCKHCSDPPEGHDYNCKNCGQPKEGCGAWLNEKQPDALFKLCDSWSEAYEANGGDAKVDELIIAGIDLRYKVRVKRLGCDSIKHM